MNRAKIECSMWNKSFLHVAGPMWDVDLIPKDLWLIIHSPASCTLMSKVSSMTCVYLWHSYPLSLLLGCTHFTPFRSKSLTAFNLAMLSFFRDLNVTKVSQCPGPGVCQRFTSTKFVVFLETIYNRMFLQERCIPSDFLLWSGCWCHAIDCRCCSDSGLFYSSMFWFLLCSLHSY